MSPGVTSTGKSELFRTSGSRLPQLASERSGRPDVQDRRKRQAKRPVNRWSLAAALQCLREDSSDWWELNLLDQDLDNTDAHDLRLQGWGQNKYPS